MDDDPLPLNFPGVSVGPLQQTITYVATAADKDGKQATASVTINVTPGAPTVTLLATPAKIISGQPSTLSWTSENATSLSIDNNVGTVPGPESSKSVSPTVTTTYTITAKGPGGTNTATATVEVAPANRDNCRICDFKDVCRIEVHAFVISVAAEHDDEADDA